MILVFIILSVLTISAGISFLILTSTLKIDIEKFNYKSRKKNFIIYFEIYLFNIIKVFSYKIDDFNIEKIKQNGKNKKIKRKVKGKKNIEIKIKDIPTILKLNPRISKLSMHIDLGTENVILTSYMVAIIGSVISIILPYFYKKYEKEKYIYNIYPNYKEGNNLKISINCIIEIKMVHIINVIYLLMKKTEVSVNERTTSNRRANGYRYE